MSRIFIFCSITGVQQLIHIKKNSKKKKLTLFVGVLFLTLAVSSCAIAPSPVLGTVYTDVKAPLAATSNAVGSKVGTSEATSILGIAATGDASIEAAAKKAGITRISHVDYQSYSVLGIFAKFTVYVYGE